MGDGNEVDDGWHEGGCHCRAIRFRVRVVDAAQLVRCTCSICRMKGILHLIVDADDFVLLQGAGQLTTYRFNTGVAQHRFCESCGIHAFYVPRSHPDGIDVNVNCLDEPARLDSLPRVEFDGAAWEASIDTLRQRLEDG